MPFSCKTASPSGSVGPLAPSATNLTFNVGAVSAVIWFSRAAGMKISAFVLRKSLRLISFEPAGQKGFGYDPVFYLPGYNCTMAQLPEAEKNRISHRGLAIKAAIPILRRLLA